MSKRMFLILILLMSLSLVGIIFVQIYYINKSLKDEKERFKFNVLRALSYVSNTVETNEVATYYKQFQNLDLEKKDDSTSVSQLLIYQKNDKETLIYRSNIFEENYKISSSLSGIGLDSLEIKNIVGVSKTEIFKNTDLLNKDLKQNPISRIVRSGSISDAQRISFEKEFKAMRKTTPLNERISNDLLNDLINNALKKNNINLDYEFAIYNKDTPTKVHSNEFEYNESSVYLMPIFYDDNNQTTYKLMLRFKNDKEYILSSTIWMILLSISFIAIIISAYAIALYLLIKQRKISEIKSDFINNMTHEFKTPIATIDLALASIKNPQVIGDKQKVERYLGMIKEENKRMHAQVENVLQISRLEKNELDIDKEPLDLHDIIQDAISHVALLVEDRQGQINVYLKAENSMINANESHFTNVVVNVLDNAIKYSPNAPKIEIYTENIDHKIILKIKDHGSGMSKAALKQVFEKFYREHTGNIHNVKGHGLGLAYVKRIVEDHEGQITAESEKDKGSTFIIKLPLN